MGNGDDNLPMGEKKKRCPQEQLAERAGTEVHRSVAVVVHAVRVPGAGRVLHRAVRHAVRQALAAQETRPRRRQVGACAVRFQQSARRRRRLGQREFGGYNQNIRNPVRL